jgi:hypothetical protein
MELVPTIFSAGWASGVNAYATVALLGILGRAGVGEVPDELTRDPVIISAALMYAIEFVTDKVPYLDNTWDLVHTAIRPAIGSLVGVEFAGDDQANELLGGAEGGTAALLSHGVKAGLRLAINVSPEPFSNIVVSLLEDVAVAGVVVLALEHPEAAAAIAAALLVAGIALVIVLARVIRRAYQSWRERRGGWRAPPGV